MRPAAEHTFRVPLSVRVRAVPPDVVAAYLLRTGWRATEQSRTPRCTTWEHARAACVVDVPAVAGADWWRRLVEILQTIAFAEARAQWDVARDLGMLPDETAAPEAP